MQRHFTIESSDGLPIRGVLEVPERNRGLVVLIHGFKGFKEWAFFPWLASEMAGARLATCRFDMSRSGIGDVPEQFDRLDLFADDTYSRQISDLIAVLSFLESDPELQPCPLSLFGHSRGGGIALLAAAKVARVSAVVTWSTISRTDRWDRSTKEKWRDSGVLMIENARTKQLMPMSTAILQDCENNSETLDILRAARQLSKPLLAIHGLADDTVVCAESREIFAAAPDSSLVTISGASHTYGAIHPLVDIPAPLKIAARSTIAFLSTRR